MYTVQAVVHRQSLKSKTFKSSEQAHRFILKILDRYNLEVSKVIESNVMGDEEYVCEGETSRFFLATV
mgnify:CR=1 FL=1